MRVWSGNVPQHDDILDNAACEGIDDDDCENTLIGDEVLAMAASTAKIVARLRQKLNCLFLV